MASGPITSWEIDVGTMETVADYFLGLQNHCGQWLQQWNEKTLAPWKKSYDKPRQCIWVSSFVKKHSAVVLNILIKIWLLCLTDKILTVFILGKVLRKLFYIPL